MVDGCTWFTFTPPEVTIEALKKDFEQIEARESAQA